MAVGFLNKLFGTNMAKELKKVEPYVRKIESLADEYKALSDAELQAKTPEFKARYQNGESLDSLLPEAFAACREAADRVLGLRPYRVQLIGGIILHQGRIAEMKTGEGKTLVATLPAYLNALTGEGVIHYTLNGDVPTERSPVYTEPISIEKTTVLRAVSFTEGMHPSAVMTERYFVNENHSLPVVSLVSPRAGLFSDQQGIYVKGYYTNYYQDWERAANIALYSAEGQEFHLDCGLKMFGAGSREYCDKKSFKLLFNGRYEGNLKHDVFEDGIVTELMKEYDGTKEELTAFVEQFTAKLQEEGLLVE